MFALSCEYREVAWGAVVGDLWVMVEFERLGCGVAVLSRLAQVHMKRRASSESPNQDPRPSWITALSLTRTQTSMTSTTSPRPPSHSPLFRSAPQHNV